MSVTVQKTRTKSVDSHSSYCVQTPWGPQWGENHKNKITTKTKTITVIPSSAKKPATLNGKEQASWIEQSTRIGTAALPLFCSLYKPFSNTFSLATGSVRIICSLQQLLSSIQKGDSSAIPLHLANACVSTFAVAGTLFAHPIGMLVTTGHDMITEILALGRNLQKGDNTKAIKNCTHLINDVLYLMVFLSGGSTAATIAYFGTQVLTGAFHSANEIRNGNYIEAAGHTLMSMIRAYQVGDQIHNWYMTRPQAAGTLKPEQPKPATPVAPATPPSPTDHAFKIILNTADYQGSNYLSAIRLEHGISLDKAFEIAKENPEIEYFVYNKGAMLEGSSEKSSLLPDNSNRWGNAAGSYKSGDTLFFKKGPMWLGSNSTADTYVKA